jgi:WD40 repeat protein
VRSSSSTPDGWAEVPLDALYWVDADRLIIGAPTQHDVPAYNLTTGEFLGLQVGSYSARDVVVSTVLDRLIAVESSVHFWATDGSGPLEVVFPLSEAQQATLDIDGGTVHAALAIDGSRLVVGALSLSALARIPPTQSFDLTTEPVTDALFERPTSLAYAYGPYTMVFDLSGFQLLDPDGEPLGPPVPLTFDMTDQAASPDGRFIAIGRTGGIVDLYTGSGELVANLDMDLSPGDGDLVLPSFSEDGTLVAASTTIGTTAVWSTDTFGRLDHLPRSGGGRLVGEWLAMRTGEGIQRFDPWTGEPVGDPLLSPPPGAFYHALDRANFRFAVPGSNEVKIYDLATGQQLGRELPIRGLRIGYTEDGSILMVPGSDRVTLWNYDTDTWAEIACELAGRNMTEDEWDHLGPRTIERRATCEQFPLL